MTSPSVVVSSSLTKFLGFIFWNF